MKSTEKSHQQIGFMKRLMKWPILQALLVLGAAQVSNGANFAGDTFINEELISYPGTVPQPPVIDATNFINNSTIDINFTASVGTPTYFNTWDTLNYVNNGLMSCNSSFLFEK